jgi:hypothetical protein
MVKMKDKFSEFKIILVPAFIFIILGFILVSMNVNNGGWFVAIGMFLILTFVIVMLYNKKDDLTDKQERIKHTNYYAYSFASLVLALFFTWLLTVYNNEILYIPMIIFMSLFLILHFIARWFYE